MLSLKPLFTVAFLWLFSLSSQLFAATTTVEAVGVAPVSGGNLSLARKAAINRAKQQALLQVGAFLT